MSADILGTSCDQYQSMVQYSFMSTETWRLVRTDSPGRPPRLSHSSWTMHFWQNDRDLLYAAVATPILMTVFQTNQNVGGWLSWILCYLWKWNFSSDNLLLLFSQMNHRSVPVFVSWQMFWLDHWLLNVFLQESLRRVLQEKLDAVTKLSDLEVKLGHLCSTISFRCVLYTIGCKY